MANYTSGAARRLSRSMGAEAAREITRDEVQRKMRAFLDGASGERLVYLRSRWLDEREYEDWNEYIAEMKKLIPEGFEFERAGKSPFGFTMTAKGMPGAMHVTATTTTIKIKHIRI